MQRIILISGFGGSGKTTSANALMEQLDSVALIQADYMFQMKPFDISTQKGLDKIGRIKLVNSLSLLKTYLNENFNNIIIEGLVWSQEELESIEKIASSDIKIYLFWLDIPKKKRFERVLKRAEPGDTLEFLEQVEKTIINPWPFKSNISTIVKIEATETDKITNVMIQNIEYY